NPEIVSSYFDAIFSFPASPVYIRTVSELLAFCSKIKDFEKLEKHKKNIIDLYVNTIFLGKIKQKTCYLKASSTLLRQITHEEFKEKILPAVQKSLLRNPELVIE
ncbi:Hypothetical predicted protein, partial [Paramuricea clavata]